MEQTNQNTNQAATIRKIVIGVLLIVALFFGGRKIVFSLTHETTDNAQIETTIVPVLTRVAGYVKAVQVKDFDSVAQNQLVVEIDDAELKMTLEEQQADLQQSLADVSNAQAQLTNAVLSLKSNNGAIDLKKIRQQKLSNDVKRDQNLFGEQAITKKQLEETELVSKILINLLVPLSFWGLLVLGKHFWQNSWLKKFLVVKIVLFVWI